MAAVSREEWIRRGVKQLGFGILFGALFGATVSIIMFGQIDPKWVVKGASSFALCVIFIFVVLSVVTRFGTKI